MNQLQICIINKKLVYPQANQEEFQNQDKNKNVKYPREEIEELEDEPEFDGKYQKCLFKCGECLKCFGTYCPYNIIVGKTFRQIQQGFAGVLLRFGKYYKTTSAGILQLNPCTDTLFIVDCRTQLLNYENQSVITKDNIQIEVSVSLYMRVIEPKRMIFNIYGFFEQAIFGLTQTSIRSVIGAFTFQDLLSERNEIQILIKEFVETHSTDWGIEIEAIMINNIQMDQQTQNTLAQVATETRAAQVKILMAQSNVQSAKMMKEAAEMLNSRAAMQIRYLEIVGNVGNEAQTKVVIM
ncbi:unnamed protein product (macronuclear) [Paramecium tetraurelia]|uniref:Band 7 domain-containing protein n=1 Tax=Paramecium tetraurelia TaxID=5888 RepID=A0E9B6_PARTE|nr:uncharacterized protein GSPATT00024614001 [Paramecium tetraurelia]CAK91883.1 unnamed protein product [Paramecium tetraurelia]|eukprot:XP_001459280.1 hypothetical protein (macronuclear) [Paramecium tetraurelia strain d4-2]